MIFNFLYTYWGDILLVILGVLVMLYLLKHKKYEELKGIGLFLVIQAEKALGSKTGTAKYSMVLEGLYSKLPYLLKFLFSKEELSEIIEASVVELRGLLASGANLNSYEVENIGGGFNECY